MENEALAGWLAKSPSTRRVTLGEADFPADSTQHRYFCRLSVEGRLDVGGRGASPQEAIAKALKLDSEVSRQEHPTIPAPHSPEEAEAWLMVSSFLGPNRDEAGAVRRALQLGRRAPESAMAWLRNVAAGARAESTWASLILERFAA